VLPSGPLPPNPSELLGSLKMQELINELEAWADWVIIDTPPLLAVSDGAAVARWADAVLVVSRSGVSTRETAQKGAEMLGNVGAKVIGVVVSGSEAAGAEGSYYAGSYYYNRYYSYYSQPVADGPRSAKHRDSGAKAPVKVRKDAPPAVEAPVWIPPKSGGRVAAEALGRVMAGALAFLAVVAVAIAIAYILDGYFHWGLLVQVLAILR
jgi:hypothetical protein